jgi:hypothetical protein
MISENFAPHFKVREEYVALFKGGYYGSGTERACFFGGKMWTYT